MSRLLVLRHTGSKERKIVEIEFASQDGRLHVRWPCVGGGGYTVQLFRGYGETGKAGRLYRGASGRAAIPYWEVEDLESARETWRAMTGNSTKEG